MVLFSLEMSDLGVRILTMCMNSHRIMGKHGNEDN
jgi:hypothetical protein